MRTDDHPAAATGKLAAAGDLAHRFATALAAKDATALTGMFGSAVDFRAMTPGRTWAASTADAAVSEIILGTWFGPGDQVELVEWTHGDMIGTRHKLAWRLRVANSDGSFIVEQQAYADLTQDKITWFRLLCSGYVPVGQIH